MCFPKRATHPNPTYPYRLPLAIGCWRSWRALAWLAASFLAGCEATAPAKPAQTAEQVRSVDVAEAPPDSLAQLQLPVRHAERVGLLVPLSGPLAAAGRAVRDGFIAAYFDDEAPRKPALHVYDTTARPIPAIYEQSLVDAVELIVGPLNKGKLEALRRLNPEVPVLGLNYLDAASADSPEDDIAQHSNTEPVSTGAQPFMQVGLAIEDEAATIAARLLAEDLQRLLAIRGAEGWAVRGAAALTAAWPFELELQEFADVKTITESVGEAMRVTASLERRDALQRLLNTDLEFLPRARSDFDGVVAFVNHVDATALGPALKFHFASHLPVFASSQSVRDASALKELNGFRVALMPFDLNAHPLWDAVHEVFGDSRGNTAALRALGMDAYLIVNNWARIARREPLQGATGQLRLARSGQIRRTLAWGQVSRGALRALPPVAQH